MTCPLCHRPTTWEENPWRPFCCERCQMTDLGTWAAERYRIPGLPLTAEIDMRAPFARGERNNGEREEAEGDASNT
ncbi:MAG: DNA gyrase inhibitor YacG [Nitrospira sp.]|nr:DNA gyrase inhibitor YacG [Nitrospira sp.]